MAEKADQGLGTLSHLPADAALLIDWENLKYSLASANRTVSISSLRDAAEKYGRLVVARAYADWQDRAHAGDAPNLYASGIEPIYVPCRQYYSETPDEPGRRKNSVDVKLTADCIELCHRYPSIETYVLVSGDQDFLHVVNTLRPYGKRTVAIGVSWSTSPRLAEQVDAMIYYDRDVEPLADKAAAATRSPQKADARMAQLAAELVRELQIPGADAPKAMERILQLILDITRDYRGRGQTLLLSQLGLELQKKTTPGEFALCVRGRLGPIAGKLASCGYIQRVERGMVHWIFLPEEKVPEELSERPPAGAYAPIRPSVLAEQVPTRTRYRTLSDGERDNLIRFISQLEASNDFLSFNRVAQELEAARTLPEDVDLRKVIDDMLNQEGVLQFGPPRDWFDPATGRTGKFNTILLNHEHGDVQSVLSVGGQ